MPGAALSRSDSGAMADERHRKRKTLLICLTGSFLVPYMSSAVNVALPAIGRQFGASAVALSWVNTAFMLATAVLLLPVGRLADIYGRKLLFMIGVACYAIASGFAALSPSPGFLIAARVLQGCGGAMTAGASVAILTSVFPPGERGRVLGFHSAMVYTGVSLGPFLGGIMTQHLGWRSIFLINVPIGALLLWLLAARLKGEWADAKGERFDIRGAVVYGVSLLTLMTGFSHITTAGGAAVTAAGVAGLIAFLIWESYTVQPMLDTLLLRENRLFLLSNLAALVNFCVYAGSVFLVSLYLQFVKGFSPQDTGFILFLQPLIQTVLSPFVGRLSDRIEPRILSTAGMASTAIGLLALTSLDAATPMSAVLACLVLLGIGFGTFTSPNTNAVMSSVGKGRYGVASATLGTMRLTGQVFSMGIVTLSLSVHMGSGAVTAENFPGFLASVHLSYVIFSALCVLGIFASFSRGHLRPKP